MWHTHIRNTDPCTSVIVRNLHWLCSFPIASIWRFSPVKIRFEIFLCTFYIKSAPWSSPFSLSPSFTVSVFPSFLSTSSSLLIPPSSPFSLSSSATADIEQRRNKNRVRTHSVTLLSSSSVSSSSSRSLFLLLLLFFLMGFKGIAYCAPLVSLWHSTDANNPFLGKVKLFSPAQYDKCLVKKNNQAKFKMPRCSFKTTRLNWLLFFHPVCAVLSCLSLSTSLPTPGHSLC